MFTANEKTEEIFSPLENFEPLGLVKKEEAEIGLASQEIKTAYIEAVLAKSEIKKLTERYRGAHGSKTKQSLKKEIEFQLYQTRLRLNNRIGDLLFAISEVYPEITEKKAMAIRRGWMIVSLPEGGVDNSGVVFEIPAVNDLIIRA